MATKKNAGQLAGETDNTPTMVTGAEPFIGAALLGTALAGAAKVAGEQAAKKAIDTLAKTPVWIVPVQQYENGDYLGWEVRVKNLIAVRAYLHDIKYSIDVLGRVRLAPKPRGMGVSEMEKSDPFGDLLVAKPRVGWLAEFAPESDTAQGRHLRIEVPEKSVGSRATINATFDFYFLNSGTPVSVSTTLLVLPNLKPRK